MKPTSSSDRLQVQLCTYVYELLLTDWVTKVKPDINSVEVRNNWVITSIQWMVRWWVVVPSGRCLALFILKRPKLQFCLLKGIIPTRLSLEVGQGPCWVVCRLKHQKWNSLWKKGKVGTKSTLEMTSFALVPKEWQQKNVSIVFGSQEVLWCWRWNHASVDSFLCAPNRWSAVIMDAVVAYQTYPTTILFFSFQFKLCIFDSIRLFQLKQYCNET